MKDFNKRTKELASKVGKNEFLDSYQELLNELKIEQKMVMNPEDLKTVKLKLIRLKSLGIAQLIKIRMDIEAMVNVTGHQQHTPPLSSLQ